VNEEQIAAVQRGVISHKCLNVPERLVITFADCLVNTGGPSAAS